MTRFAIPQTPTPQTNASPYTPATPLATRAAHDTRAARSARFPDPPLLSDGKAVTFEQWRDGLEDKLRANRDWYGGHTAQDTEGNIISYMRTRTEGDANLTLATIIRTLRQNGEPLDHQYLIDRLEKGYGDPHKELNARRDFQKLYCRSSADFARFQNDFFRLAQERRLPPDQ